MLSSLLLAADKHHRDVRCLTSQARVFDLQLDAGEDLAYGVADCVGVGGRRLPCSETLHLLPERPLNVTDVRKGQVANGFGLRHIEAPFATVGRSPLGRQPRASRPMPNNESPYSVSSVATHVDSPACTPSSAYVGSRQSKGLGCHVS